MLCHALFQYPNSVNSLLRARKSAPVSTSVWLVHLYGVWRASHLISCKRLASPFVILAKSVTIPVRHAHFFLRMCNRLPPSPALRASPNTLYSRPPAGGIYALVHYYIAVYKPPNEMDRCSSGISNPKPRIAPS